MAKVFYVEDSNGEYLSVDKTRRFKALRGKELNDYLKSSEGRAKRFFIEDDVGIEITTESKKEIRKYERRKQYVSDITEKNNYSVVSLTSEELENDGCSGEEVIADVDADTEELAISNIMSEKLKVALTYLNEEELTLITQLIYSNFPVTQRELSFMTGLPQKTIDNRKTAILRKLKKFLEN